MKRDMIAVIALCLFIWQCAGTSKKPGGDAMDARADSGIDAQGDTSGPPRDAEADVPSDGETDVSLDAKVDVPSDADVPSDTKADVPADIEADILSDTGKDIDKHDEGEDHYTVDTSADQGVEIDGADQTGEDAFPPYPEPLEEGIIKEVDLTMWKNLDDFMFTVLPSTGVLVYMTLFDANFFNTKKYRAIGQEIIRHPESFFINAVIPIIQRYEASGVIWAIDCLNEPEAMTAGDDGNYGNWGVSWEEMRSFLSFCADVIHMNSGIPVSAGSGWHKGSNIVKDYYDGLGFDFIDFHYYADQPDLPGVSTLGVAVPVIIGECGQSTQEWNDTLQYNSVNGCFSQAQSEGYSAALSWYYNYAGSDNVYTHLNPDESWRPVIGAFENFMNSNLEVGVNLAWFSGAYNHDFGVNPYHPTWTVAYQHDYVKGVIDDIDDAGIGLLRLWIFEGQEGLPFHTVFDDFEVDLGGWEPINYGTTSVRSSFQHTGDGSHSLAMNIDASSVGWYGMAKKWTLDVPLNIQPVSKWSYVIYNDMDEALGVNLAFVTHVNDTIKTYQTRSGSGGGQIWLSPGQGGAVTVSLSANDFSSVWSLDTDPQNGVIRPSDEEMESVVELRIRVYFSTNQLPAQGDIFIDALRIH